MKRFLLRILAFLLFCFVLGDIIVRVFKLTPDIPQRFVDESGIQRYYPGQSGYFTNYSHKWQTNQFGWPGTADTSRKNTITIIGDSYIENIMNPIECHQGTLLQKYFKDTGFFEAGRAGVTFIEAMEISRLLDSTIKPDHHVIYAGTHDFYESIANKKRYDDVMQIDLDSQKILKAQLKSPGLKKLLYNLKLIYYFYLRYPIFSGKGNNTSAAGNFKRTEPFDYKSFTRFFNYCSANYDVKRITIVFHPETEAELVKMAKEYGYNTVELVFKDPAGLYLSDGHWTCLGHKTAAMQVKNYLESISAEKAWLH